MNLKSFRSVLAISAASVVLAAGCGDSGSSQTQQGNANQDVNGDDMGVNLGDSNQGGDTAKPDTTKPDTTVSDSTTGGCVTDNDCVGKVANLAPCEKAWCAAGVCKAGPSADGDPCDDGNKCFTGRTCKADKCQGGTAVSCQDNNPCTDNKCDTKTGCVATNNQVPCDDGDKCTSDDTCAAGACKGTPNGTCQTGPETDCGNAKDDDKDGLTDCADNDCAADAACKAVGPETACQDQQDNDKDGATDCADSDCANATGCQKPTHETDCGNKVDDDGDGQTDCADNDCGQDAACLVTPTKEANCTDTLDEDKDGQTDCADADCASDPACQSPEKNCANSIDDDKDGFTDCKDNDCSVDPACAITVTTETNCSDGKDNDLDGKIDCQDIDCAKDPTCVVAPEADCANKVDDDKDGFTDCSDSDCAKDAKCASKCDVCAQSADPLTANCDPCAATVCKADSYCCDTAWDDVCVGEVGTLCKKQCAAPTTETNCADKVDDDLDGKTDCADSDCAKDPACAGKETNCGNKVDDDKDGLTDCGDSDCKADPACAANKCVDAGVSTCGGTEKNANNAKGSTQVLSAYECKDGKVNGETGAEYTYSYTAACDGPVVVTLIKQSTKAGYLDLFILDAVTGCQASSCIAHALMSSTQATQTFTAKKDGKYFIVVDGYQGFASDYSLKITCGCAGGKETNCTDKVDNDGDKLVDCLDSDCAADLACAPTVETSCTDKIDNDKDGKLDCADSDCATNLACAPTVETICGDKLDNDLDGKTDCADSDCAKDTACTTGTTETNCANKLDDDKDGLTDCADGDCAKDVACQLPVGETLCTDKVDNDADGLVDCADPDCSGKGACACQTASTLNCNTSDLWNNSGMGSTKAVSTYVCKDGTVGSETGPEYVYDYTASCDGELTVALTKTSTTSGYLDLFLLDGGQACGSNACVAHSLMSGTSATQTITVKSGQKLGIAVDGYNAYAGNYSIKTTCKCGVTKETSCTNKVDDDKDGKTDCADSDCAKDVACVPPGTEANCTDKVDNDKDGKTDCSDSDCTKDVACATPATETNCSDKIDNDKDGKADCADNDCAKDPSCLAATQCKADYPMSCGDSDSYSNNGTGSTKAIADWQCADGSMTGETGNEYTYTYTAACDGPVTATLTKTSTSAGYIDLFVLDAAKSCASNACLVHGLMSSTTAKTTWTAKKGQTYYVVADGYNNYNGNYTLKIDCSCAAPTTETNCTDKIDDDKDGKTDCADSDCAADAACKPAAAQCVPDYDLACGGSDQYSNGGAGSTKVIDSWQCTDGAEADYAGPEYTYTYDATCTGDVTVTVKKTSTSSGKYLDLFILDGSKTCGAATCTSHALMMGNTATKTFAGTKGNKYFIVVDGYQGAVEDYQIDVKCACK